jgi:hypothetical protein
LITINSSAEVEPTSKAMTGAENSHVALLERRPFQDDSAIEGVTLDAKTFSVTSGARSSA